MEDNGSVPFTQSGRYAGHFPHGASEHTIVTPETPDIPHRHCHSLTFRDSLIQLVCLFILLTAFCLTKAKADWPNVAISRDGTPIAYEVFGSLL